MDYKMYAYEFDLGVEHFILGNRLYDSSVSIDKCEDPDFCPIEFPIKINTIVRDQHIQLLFYDDPEIDIRAASDNTYIVVIKQRRTELTKQEMIDKVNDYIRNRVCVMPVSADTFTMSNSNRTYSTNVSIREDRYGFYITSQQWMLDFFSETYHFSKNDIIDKFGLQHNGTWPYGTREQQLLVMEFLNGHTEHIKKEQKITYSDDKLRINAHVFIVKQNKKTGKYYLCGNIETLYKLLGIAGRDEFLRIVRTIDEKEKLFGISPEFSDRATLDELINLIIKYMHRRLG